MKNIKILRLVTACVTLTYGVGSSSTLSSLTKALQEAMAAATAEGAGVEDKSIPEQLEEIAKGLRIPLEELHTQMLQSKPAQTPRKASKNGLKTSTPGFTPEEMQLLNEAINKNNQEITNACHTCWNSSSSCADLSARDVSALRSHEWLTNRTASLKEQKGEQVTTQQREQEATLGTFIKGYTIIAVKNVFIEKKYTDLLSQFQTSVKKWEKMQQRLQIIEGVRSHLEPNRLDLVQKSESQLHKSILSPEGGSAAEEQALLQEVGFLHKRLTQLDAEHTQNQSSSKDQVQCMDTIIADLLTILEQGLSNLGSAEKLKPFAEQLSQDGITPPLQKLGLLSEKYTKFTQNKELLLSIPNAISRERDLQQRNKLA